MALLNPAYGLIVPFLFVVTIPLAILAGITTTLAFTVLMFRVAVVYLDIAVNMVPQYITGHRIFPFPRAYATSVVIARQSSAVSDMPLPPISSSSSTIDSRAAVASGQTTPRAITATTNTTTTTSTTTTTTRAGAVGPARHHRRRRTSTASFASVGSITPIEDPNTTISAALGARSSSSSNNNINNNNSNNTTTITKRADSVMIIPSIGMDRDFEGVGGWRLNGKDADDDDAWTQLNSRLELPLDTSRRQHHRSPSGGATTPGGGGGNSGTGGDYLMMKSPHAPRSKDASPDNTPGKRGRGERTGSSAVGTTMSPNSSRHRTPTASNVLGLSSSASSAAAVPPPLTARDRSDGSYFPLLSPKVARRAGSGGT